jgi:hypothetical protein
MSPSTPRSLPHWLVALLALILVVLAAGRVARVVVTSRVRATAAARGLDAAWGSLTVGPTPQARFHDLILTRRADGDTVFRAESLAVSLDPWALLLLRSRVARVDLAHATLRRRSSRQADADTLLPGDPSPPGTGGDGAGAERVRSAGRSLVRLLAAPARQLPRLSLRDLSITLAPRTETGEPDVAAAPAGLRLHWLALAPTRRGVRLAAEGELLGERAVGFAAAAEYGHDDRLVGGARFDVPGGDNGRERFRIAVDGALTQDRRGGRVAIADTTRVTIGTLRFRLGAALERSGPRFRVVVAADSLTAAQWRESLPAAVLGPLSGLAVRGWYAYRVSLDLDLSRPDSVAFTADVVPHGLQIDAVATRLNLLDLDQPFLAHIHLPHERIVERDLSEANPDFRPLTAIDTLLVHAVVTNEDGAFFRHRGFNTEAVKGAIAENARAGTYRRGAGTITMQLVRNLYLGHARTLSRKGQEVVLAWVLEHLTQITKERMLEIYFNIIEWGPGVHGADEATHYYFGHDAGRLTPDEALFLATVVPAPARWRNRFDETGTLRPFERAQMHFIGRAMMAKGWLSPASLPGADSLHVDLRGPARDVLFPPTEAHADTIPN